jgi:serine/threonine-protein kinase
MVASLRQVGAYQPLQLLSSKPGSRLYRARSVVDGRTVALKTGPSADNSQGSSSVERERLVLTELKSPHVVPLLDCGSDDSDLHYIVLQWADGGSLFDQASRMGRFGPRSSALTGVLAAAKGLRAAHDRGWVHCDFKPHNILCATAPQIHLADWGSAQHIESPDPRMKGWGGSPLFLSPQHLEATPLSPNADIFSFGLSLHWALTGAFANAGPGGLLSTVSRTVSGTLTSPQQLAPETPDWLERLFLRCVESDPCLRIQHGADLCAEIEEHEEHEDS